MYTTTRFPHAEHVAATMPLPLTTCATTRELYDYARPVLDRDKAIRSLCDAGIRYNTLAFDAAMEILDERADALASR